MEDLLENNVWIRDAELYFDNKDVLHVTVTEREPVARIFTTEENHFILMNREEACPYPKN